MVSSASLILLLSIFLLWHTALANISCNSILTCSICISTPSCLWCAKPVAAHCLSQYHDTSSCSDHLVRYHSNITEIDEVQINELNQISLQSAKVKLRVNDPFNITFFVKAAEDYPLDLYVLMDISFSFKDDLQSVKNIAPQLPLSLRNVSSSFQIGFGAYVDKPILPFASNKQLRDDLSDNDVTVPYGYEHSISLTNSSDLFNSTVQEIVISTNVDNPEGTLDAMLQAIVCDSVIGWRDESRKIILVMTDDGIHSAGDGILAGITKPNDGKCHTSYDQTINRTLYRASLMQDYPSMESVRAALSEDDIVPVFAVAPNINGRSIIDFFNDTVSPILNGFTVELTQNSSNLVQVLNEAYLKVVSNARLIFRLPPHLSASVTADCTNYRPGTMECVNIGNETIKFTLSLNLKECTQDLRDGSSNEVIVNIPGFAHFSIGVSGHCRCGCEDEIIDESSHCSNNGNFSCGLCDCNEGWSGPTCSCSTKGCPLGANGQTCSGRGVCTCSQCRCSASNVVVPGIINPQIYGSACECSNYECNADSTGRICSGLGTCTCSEGIYTCECDNSTVITGERRTGDSCQCSHDHCINIDNTDSLVPCTGHGRCNPCEPQGRACTCDEGYSGPYCETTYMVGSLVGTCDDSSGVRVCVMCYGEAAKSGSEISSTCGSRSCLNYTLLSSSATLDDYDVPGAIMNSTTDCSFVDGECQYYYYVGQTASRTNVYSVLPSSCLPIPIWAIALIVLAFLVIVGIVILVVIKCCCVYLDHKEFKKFQSEVSKATFGASENPMYHEPAVTYKNVAYGKE